MSEAKNERRCIEGLWAICATALGWTFGSESKPDAEERTRKAPDSHRHVHGGREIAVEHTLFPTTAQQKAIEAQFRQVRESLPRELAGLGFIRAVVQLQGTRLPCGLDEDLMAYLAGEGWPPGPGSGTQVLGRTGLAVAVSRNPDGHDRVVWNVSMDLDEQAERLKATIEEAEEKFAAYANARRMLLIESDDWMHVGADTFPRLLAEAGIGLASNVDDIWTVETGVPEEFHYRVLVTEDSRLRALHYAAWTPATSQVDVNWRR